jgi:hypothetical protein
LRIIRNDKKVLQKSGRKKEDQERKEVNRKLSKNVHGKGNSRKKNSKYEGKDGLGLALANPLVALVNYQIP